MLALQYSNRSIWILSHLSLNLLASELATVSWLSTRQHVAYTLGDVHTVATTVIVFAFLRLWCPFELYSALQQKIEIGIAGSQLFVQKMERSFQEMLVSSCNRNATSDLAGFAAPLGSRPHSDSASLCRGEPACGYCPCSLQLSS